jgi:hypothetical protein
LLNSILLLDSILQHLWISQTIHSTYSSYVEMIEQIKHTPRIWNLKFNLRNILQHLSWTLCANVNVIGFQRCRNNANAHHNTKQCMFPYYIFQNSIVKLLRFPHRFPPLNIIYAKKQYYLLKSNDLKPYLINIHSENTHIIFENQCITPHDILNIIKMLPVTFTFNIQVYTSYYYTHVPKSSKIIEKNMIGNFYLGSEKKTLHLFVSPLLENGLFNLHILNDFIVNTTFNKYNIVSKHHIPEGNKFFYSKRSTDILLNQDNCICDHPDTKQLLTPIPSSFKKLGSIFFITLK